MDTSTYSFTSPNEPKSLPRTSTPYKSHPQPGGGGGAWYTRLISPLTDTRQSDTSPLSTPRLSPAQLPMQEQFPHPPEMPTPKQPDGDSNQGFSTALLIFIPIMVVVLTVLLGLIVFLVAVLFMRKRRGIRLTEDGGPLDLSKSDGVIGEGGVDGVEARWLENVEPDVREAYNRAKDWQAQYPPASIPTDITLSQFLSIQEKGVSAWSFEPDYEENLSLYVQSRTEITFLADGPGMAAREGGGNSVMANLPLPKLNEVYYWEVKMYEKPVSTEVSIGLATKPYPSFRLPGWNKYSVAYFASDGFKSHNYPFTASSHGPPLAEGDVLGVGYKPRTGTVFFTRNGRKMDDAYCGLQRLNLFPTIGANGPCTVHVNLGQAGFVFIEANVKKWGLAPMTGTLAPPPAYGSERGSILLDAGYGTPHANQAPTNLGGVGALLEAARARANVQFGSSIGSSQHVSSPGGSIHSSRRQRSIKTVKPGSVPVNPSPLRARNTYVSPTDTPHISTRIPSPDALEYVDSESETDDSVRGYDTTSSHETQSPIMPPNPPTPNLLDISMHSLNPRNSRQHYFGGRGTGEEVVEDGEEEEDESGESDETARPPRLTMAVSSGRQGSPPPPGYAPLDPNVYSGGLPADLPEEMIHQAIAAMGGDE
ncbi:hypothetical protein TREMEDRAFT_71079 [Tremella mesenterica DSM 1558]|uniref:uncharacterized protein n=1 Tax=Tremella mesenterica (strain ATCC 24925 / CBS 8224 / DSM 1558 / NBRC 9311 / NRRL Y-6157 / RJB 2259-6 / UBC 559-6) TaxID=578456 RepID=UPI0003F49CE4|nr:uncharacterized protein TREMEDRAFT_71079 [Tremella mesenterica DSM 1558]EIW71170.1 hypothetical protein TREMEDRAFT_71079 [Tremella mesenterica DSM 1558]